MKKILQISNYYPPDIGGIEIVAQSVTSSKYRSKCTVIPCCVQPVY